MRERERERVSERVGLTEEKSVERIFDKGWLRLKRNSLRKKKRERVVTKREREREKGREGELTCLRKP